MKKLLLVIVMLSMLLAFAIPAAAADQPIPGIPENPANAGNTNTAPIRQPGLTCNPYAVFDPTDILMDGDFGMPVRLGYRTVQEYYAEIRYLAQTYPDITKLHTYGTTKYYKWPLLALEISNNPGGNDGRPGTLHQAGNHPREWLSNELCMDLAWYLLTQYGKIADVTELLDTTTVWLVPITNPDGIHYDQTVSGPGNWRGNLGGANGTTINSGSDLNRNWPYGWGSNNGSAAGYGTGQNRGAAPESEPEISGLTALARSTMIQTGISGHQFPSGNGQYLVFPWGFLVNRTANPGVTGTPTKANSTPNTIMIDTANGQIDIRDLGYRQARFNLHSAEYGNIMYAYSGESGDYLYGTLRTLPFLYEYNRWLMQAYLGQNMNFATTSFNDLYTGKQREFLVSYATAANSAGAGAPKADLTAQMVFISDDGFVPDYGPLTATTVADVNALGTALNGKILVCMIAANNNDNAAIAIAAQSRGAVGVLFCTRLSSLQGYQHSHYTPNLGTGTAANNNPALITIPVAGTAKQYLRELYEKSLADPTTTMTLNTGLRRLESQKWQFERQLGAFMENMGMAAEYSSHVKGVIKDSAGNPLPQAALNLKMQVFSPQLTSGSGNWAHQITQSGVLEQTQTALYNVAGGAYDWFVTPSKQPTNPVGIGATQFPDLGYDITASANGKYSSTKNVKIAQYQATVSGVDFVLPDAITVDFDFAQVLNPKFTLEIPFSTYIMTAGGLDSAKGSPDGAVTASANGYDVEVVDLGGGDYKAVFSPYKECAVSGAGTAEFVIEIDGTNVLPHSVYTDMLIFSAAGDYAVYLTCGQTSLESGDTLYVDVMLKGLFNYTQVTADIAYDADLLDFYGYENMGGFISACSPLGAGLAAVRSIPTTNMILGGSCLAGERIVTLKFMVKSSAAEQSAATALYVATALVNPPAGYLGTNAIAGPDLPASLTLHTQTYANLYASVQGETNANAAYTAFAAQALADGYPAIARLFTATADAELKHADDEWNILAGMGATVRPTADAPTVGTTLDNLLAAFNGETYEYTVMYPGFLATAQAEGITAAATIFRRAGAAEAVHAGNYADVRALLEAGDTAAIEADYAVLYRCVTCGEVVTARPTNCPICNVPGSTFVQYQ